MLPLRRIDAQSDDAVRLQIIQVVIDEHGVEILDGIRFLYGEPIAIQKHDDKLITKEKGSISYWRKPVLRGFYVLHDHRPRSKNQDRKSTRLNSSHSQISY